MGKIRICPLNYSKNVYSILDQTIVHLSLKLTNRYLLIFLFLKRNDGQLVWNMVGLFVVL